MKPLKMGLVLASTLLSSSVAAQTAPPYQQPVAEETGGQYAGQRGFGVQLMVGPAYQRLYSLDIAAGDIELNFGSQQRWGAIFTGINGNFGRSAAGLFVNNVRASVFYEADLSPIRLGAGLQLGTLGVLRATNARYALGVGLGLRAHVAWDMTRWDTGALFVNARASVDFGATETTPTPQIAGHLGLRFF